MIAEDDSDVLTAKEITMQAALRIQTKVLKGGRIEVIAPQFSIGELVDIIILPLADTEFSGERRSVLEISDEVNGHHAFRNAEEADRYLAEERSLWER